MDSVEHNTVFTEGQSVNFYEPHPSEDFIEEATIRSFECIRDGIEYYSIEFPNGMVDREVPEMRLADR